MKIKGIKGVKGYKSIKNRKTLNKEIFRNNVEGIYLPDLKDFVDRGHLFQDSNGTISVTGVEQPVGKIIEGSPNGNSIIQPTDADRPILSARVNMLENTEDLTADNWIGFWAGYTMDSTNNIAPDGTNTAAKITTIAQEGRLTGIHENYGLLKIGEVYTCKVWLKGENGGEQIRLCIGTSGTAGTSITLTNDWVLYSHEAEAIINTRGIQIITENSNTSLEFYIWHPDCRPADQATGLLPDYQRVGDVDTDPTDYDWGDFPWYLGFNGVNTWMYVPNMTPNSDEVFAAVGVRKESDDATAMLVEHTENSNTISNSFRLLGPSLNGANSYRFGSYGSLDRYDVGSGDFAPAPDTSVIRCVAKTGSNKCEIYQNGSNRGSVTGVQGSGNYTNDTLYIGSRAGSGFFFNGNVYSLILTFRIPSKKVISKTERLINQNTKAY